MSETKNWHPEFLKYMEYIVHHPNYAGIPYTKNAEGKINWIAPKVGVIGKARIDWIVRKATELSITNEPGMYAKVMFQIHPTKEKPCQICGKIMSLRYIYLNQNFVTFLNKNGIECSTLNSIYDICEQINEKFGNEYLVTIISEKFHIPVELGESIDSIGNRCELLCRNGNCKLLGPGAMSNFPDRLDGFHTYNRCCRKKEDTGRHDDNMKTYNKDRRAYEYWSDGNIYAANKFMNSNFFKDASADHVGPISLGFKHDPLLLRRMSCSDNSAKRDRLRDEDIKELIDIEKNNKDFSCASWFIEYIWKDIKKNYPNNCNLDKYREILKQNMFLFMSILKKIKDIPSGTKFLEQKLLSNKYTYFNYEYEFNSTGHIISQSHRKKTDASKSEFIRFQRIAFEAIDEYTTKENRRTSITFNASEQLIIKDILENISNNDFDGALTKLNKLIAVIQIRLCSE